MWTDSGTELGMPMVKPSQGVDVTGSLLRIEQQGKQQAYAKGKPKISGSFPFQSETLGLQPEFFNLAQKLGFVGVR